MQTVKVKSTASKFYFWYKFLIDVISLIPEFPKNNFFRRNLKDICFVLILVLLTKHA